MAAAGSIMFEAFCAAGRRGCGRAAQPAKLAGTKGLAIHLSGASPPMRSRAPSGFQSIRFGGREPVVGKRCQYQGDDASSTAESQTRRPQTSRMRICWLILIDCPVTWFLISDPENRRNSTRRTISAKRAALA